jgi:hypothetical protein
VDDLLADNRRQLDRLLDPYLAGDFPKDVLTERKTRLETTIAALDHERAGLVATLEARTLTPGQIQSLQDFAARVGQGLTVVDANSETKRRILDNLNVTATLAVEGGQRVVHARCILGEKSCQLRPIAQVAQKDNCHYRLTTGAFIPTVR